MTDWQSREGARKGQDLAREQAEQQSRNRVELRRFESGQRAIDRESTDDSQVLVLGANGKSAEECYIAAIGQTVAEANPEYPADDPVADVAFIKDTEDSMGIGFGTDDVLELYADGDLDRARIKAYGYPESRLTPVDGEGE